MSRLSGGTVQSVYQRDKRKCWICHNKVALPEATRDHVEPRSVGGYNKSKNYRLAHRICNSARATLPAHLVQEVYDAFTVPPTAQSMSEALSARFRQYVKDGR